MNNDMTIINQTVIPYDNLLDGMAIHACEVCYKLYLNDQLIAVDGIEFQKYRRVTPWYVCKPCAQKISDAYKDNIEGVARE